MGVNVCEHVRQSKVYVNFGNGLNTNCERSHTMNVIGCLKKC